MGLCIFICDAETEIMGERDNDVEKCLTQPWGGRCGSCRKDRRLDLSQDDVADFNPNLV